MHCHGADQGGPLPHSAGKFGGFAVLESEETIIFQKLQDIIGIFLRDHVIQFQPQNDILIDRAPFKKMVFLQHVSDF